METKTIVDAEGTAAIDLAEEGLHVQVVIDKDDRHFFVVDMISGNKTPIYETREGVGRDEIVAHVQGMIAMFQGNACDN
jgi:hypothetical protein